MKRVSRLFSGTTAAVLSLSSLLAMSFPGIAHAVAQTCTWTGAGSDTKFSTVENWSNCGGAAPVAGDILQFPELSSGQSSDVDVVLDDDVNVAYGGIAVDRSSTSGDGYTYYSWSGAITLTDGASISTYDGGHGSSIRRTYLSFYSGSPSYTPAVITAQGALTVMVDVVAVVHVGGTLTIGDGTVYDGYLSAETGSTFANDITVNAYAQFRLVDDVTATINLKKSGTLVAPINLSAPLVVGGGNGGYDARLLGQIVCGEGNTAPMGCNSYVDTTYTISGDITLQDNLVAEPYESTTIQLTGNITYNGHTITAQPDAPGVLKIGNNIIEVPEVATEYTDEQPTSNVSVSNKETATLSGVRGNIVVNAGGTLKGTGAVVNNVHIAEGARIAPGNSPGCLTTGTLTLNGEYQFELGGDEPCDGYDQIVVTSTTGTTVTFDADAATLTTSRYNGYTPEQGQVFTIIENEGSEAVSGTFKGLVEGATFEQNGIVFKISYVGGDGNDVTLTVQNVPTVPDTGFALVTANPVLSLGLMTVAAGLIFAIARRTRLSNVVAHSKSARRIKK